MKTPTAGIDVASTSAYCCLLSPEGQKLHEGNFAATAGDARHSGHSATGHSRNSPARHPGPGTYTAVIHPQLGTGCG